MNDIGPLLLGAFIGYLSYKIIVKKTRNELTGMALNAITVALKT